MKVKLKTNTCFSGRTLKIGETIEIKDEIAARWFKIGIAEIIEEKPVEVETENGEVDITKLSAKKLYQLCIEEGLEVEKQKPKQYYIDQLKANIGG